MASWKPLGKPWWTGHFLQVHPVGSLASELHYKDLWGHLVQCAHFTDEEWQLRKGTGLPKGTQWQSQARAAAQRCSGQLTAEAGVSVGPAPASRRAEGRHHSECRVAVWKSTNSAQACPCLGAPATQAPIPSAEEERAGEREGF